MVRKETAASYTAFFFIIIPTVLIILGLLIFQYPLAPEVKMLLPIPLFSGLIFLGAGFLIQQRPLSNKLKIAGWAVFAFYWSTQPHTLYVAEQGDIVNAVIAIVGIYVLFYFAYHEWLSWKRNETVNCLRWSAGAAAIAGLIYYIIDLTPLADILIEIVAGQSGWLLNLFTGNVVVEEQYILYNLAHIRIIFACTAVQSMVLFVGMILPIPQVDTKRKIYGLLITVIPVYSLNLVRNALITYLVGIKGESFFGVAHNIIGKGGSLIALVILLLIVTKIVPEIFDEIIALTDLPKRDGPLEKYAKKIIGEKKKR